MTKKDQLLNFRYWLKEHWENVVLYGLSALILVLIVIFVLIMCSACSSLTSLF